MARLPAPEDIQRARMPANTPGINLKTPDFSPLVEGAKAMAVGLGGSKDRPGLAQGFHALASMNDEVDDYETKKKLLDFQLNAEMKLAERERDMPLGAQGYADGWASDFKGMAAEFVGKNDANIAPAQRAKVGLALKRIETQLQERATRSQFAEQDRAELDGLNETTNRLRGTVEADPGRLDEARNEGRSLIELSRLTPAAKHKALQTYEKELEKTYFISRMGRVKTKEDLDALKEELGPDLPDKKITVTPRGRSRLSQANSEVAGQAFQFFLNKGLDANKAAAIAANMAWEGGGKSDLVNPGDNYKNSPRAPHSAGIAQWNDRLPAAIQFWKSQGIDVPEGDLRDANYVRRMIKAIPLEAQLEWTWHEMNSSERAALGRIQGAGDLPGAVAGAIGYHRPAGWSAGNPTAGHGYRDRLNIASEILANYGVEGSAPGGNGDPKVPAYEGPMSRLTITERKAYWNQAQTEWQKQISAMDQAIKSYESNAAIGKLPGKEELAALTNRVAVTKDPLLTSRLNTLLGTAEQIRELASKSPLEVEAFVKGLEAKYATTANPEEQKMVKTFRDFASSMTSETSKDPMTWAGKYGVEIPKVFGPPDGQPPNRFQMGASLQSALPYDQLPREVIRLRSLDFRSPDIGERLTERGNQAQLVANFYGQTPKYFTALERDYYGDQLRRGGPDMLKKLGMFYKAWGGEGMMAAAREISKNAPEVAWIGKVMAEARDPDNPPQVVKDAATGLKIRTDEGEKFINKISGPWRAQVEQLNSEIAPVLAATPGLHDPLIHSAAAVYNYRHRRDGLQEFSLDLYNQTLRELMGETRDEKGNKFGGVGYQHGWLSSSLKSANAVQVPTSVRQDKFDDVLEAITYADLEKIGVPQAMRDGKPLSLSEIRSAQWRSVGHDKYALVMGNDAQDRPIYVYGPDRRPYTFDLGQILPAIKLRRPDLFQ